MSALSHFRFEEAARRERSFWGRLVESSVGAHLLGSAMAGDCEVFYWRERGREVDFVLKRGNTLAAVEVKKRTAQGRFPGHGVSSEKTFNPARILVVGERGCFLKSSSLRGRLNGLKINSLVNPGTLFFSSGFIDHLAVHQCLSANQAGQRP
ncbi:MAG: DUF4143 domain-containing protein [Desulfobacterales bacterium]|nr:DUF4143 domain-containing protein [Desulfobacterales bacterium]